MGLFRSKSSRERDWPLIAVIDDEEDICRLLQLALRARGYRVEMAFDGETGLQLVRSRPPALILLDIKMPRMNGFEVLARLQADPRLASVPVVVMTSLTQDSDEDDDQWRERLSVAAYLTKPIDPDQVAELISRTLSKPTTQPSD
jgi:CheY-like chemotaxis protein